MNFRKGIKWCTYGVFFFLWTVISPVAFHGEFNKSLEEISPDGNYRAVTYQLMPSTPLAIIQIIFDGAVFLVLYDKDGNYLGQSSPFHFTDVYGVFTSNPRFPRDLSSDDDLYRSFVITADDSYQDSYQIPVDYMHWWSRLLSVFY